MLNTLAPGQFYGERRRDAALGNGLMLVENCYAARSRVPLHVHASPYVGLVLDGSFREVHGRSEHELLRSSVFFHPAGEPHKEQHGNDEVRIFSVQLTPDFLRRAEHQSLVAGAPLNLRSADLASLGRRAYVELMHRDPLSLLALEAYVLELLVAVRRLTVDATRDAPSWLRKIRERLTDNCADVPSLSTLAAEAGVHPAHVSRAFRHHFHCTITEYARKIRIARAETYLSATELPLAEVAMLVGYSDQSHFSAAFKRERGIPPDRYRQSLRC
jgi:AraC family transcriptional regulator